MSASDQPFKLSVIIPVYNEFHTLRAIVERVRAVDIPKEIILVDDCSTDGTRDLYADLKPLVDRIVLHEKNQGKGAAIRTGVQYATGDVVIIQDADLEYDPQEYHVLAQADPRRQGRRGLRLALPRRPCPPRALFLAHDRQQVPHPAVEHVHQPHPVGHGNLLQDDHRRTSSSRSTSSRTASASSRRSPRSSRAWTSASTRWASPTRAAATPRARRSAGRTGFKAVWCILKYSRGRYKDYGKQTLRQLESFRRIRRLDLQED